MAHRHLLCDAVMTIKGRIKNKLFYGLLDGYSLPPNCPRRVTLQELLKCKLKYGFAAAGLPLTGNERKLLLLKNKHRGERCFIIGNGPSLNSCDLTKLKGEHTFGVNSIFLNYQRMGFYPTYYVVEDILVAEDRAGQINGYQQSIKFIGNYLDYCLSGSGETVWLNVMFRYDEYDGFPNFSTDALKRIWVGGTVSYLCIQLAYYMGFETVFLVGFDHHYEIPVDAHIEGNRILSMSDDPNHFSSGYFGKGYRWHLPRVERMERAYRKAKIFFERDGRTIYNATVGGNLEVFERVNFVDLFNSEQF